VKDDPPGLADELRRVEAIRAIKRLQHSHAHFVMAHRWQDVADLFAREGVLMRGDTVIKGRATIQAYLQRERGPLRYGRLLVELVMSPVVTLAPDGRHGKARWHELTIDAVVGDYADWAGGIQENDYLFEDGEWKIARLRYYPQFAGPYLPGWRGLNENPQLVPYHFTPSQAGRPAASVEQGSINATPDALAGRVKRLEDEAAIQNLQNAWGYYVDRRLWDDVADLYAVDATLCLARGVETGRGAIRAALETMAPALLPDGELNDHLLFAPVITIDPAGTTATARGIVLGMIGVNDVDAQWTVAIYDNDYVECDGVWMIAASRLYPRAATDYYRGWAESQLADHPSWQLATNRPDDRFPNVAMPDICFTPLSGALQCDNVQGLARRIAAAAAKDAIENIACAYGYYIDEFRWHETAALFSERGWKELSYIGTYIGRDRVLGSLIARYGDKGRVSPFLAIHQKMQPVITVAPDGLTARIHLRLFQIGALPSGPGPFIGGVYENEAVLEDGVWKISGMDLDYIWFSGYAEGWGKVDPAVARQFAPKPGAMDHYPPDGPLRGPVFSPFPAQETLPFHFRNPVSGRAPPRLLD
jgi:hypothetical protein